MLAAPPTDPRTHPACRAQEVPVRAVWPVWQDPGRGVHEDCAPAGPGLGGVCGRDGSDQLRACPARLPLLRQAPGERVLRPRGGGSPACPPMPTLRSRARGTAATRLRCWVCALPAAPRLRRPAQATKRYACWAVPAETAIRQGQVRRCRAARGRHSQGQEGAAEAGGRRPGRCAPGCPPLTWHAAAAGAATQAPNKVPARRRESSGEACRPARPAGGCRRRGGSARGRRRAAAQHAVHRELARGNKCQHAGDAVSAVPR